MIIIMWWLVFIQWSFTIWALIFHWPISPEDKFLACFVILVTFASTIAAIWRTWFKIEITSIKKVKSDAKS